MKVILALSALAAVVFAADDIPDCATSCIEDSIKKVTDCDVADFDCSCKDDNFKKIQDGATSCVVDKCGISVALGMLCRVLVPQGHLDQPAAK